MSRTRSIQVVFAILAIAFFAAPIALRVVGVKADAFENRRLADAPKLSQGWDAFAQGTQYLIDRLPLRDEAVRANTRIWSDVFDTTPRYGGRNGAGPDRALPFAFGSQAGAEQGDPKKPAGPDVARIDVLEGNGEWLFMAYELSIACKPQEPFPMAVRDWAGLVTAVRDSGRPAFLFVAPEKGSIYPEHLPSDFHPRACAERGKRQLWALLEGTPGSTGIVSLRDPVLAEKRDSDVEVFKRKDTHWNAVGALAMAREVLATVGGTIRVRPDEIVPADPITYTGDLTNQLGEAEADETAHLVISRKKGAARVPGRTVIVGDSFAKAPRRLLVPYFEDLRLVSWDGPQGLARVAREIAAADTVLFETVERSFADRAAGYVPRVQLELKPLLRPR